MSGDYDEGEHKLLLKVDAAEALFDACRDAWLWMNSISPDLKAQNEASVKQRLLDALIKADGWKP